MTACKTAAECFTNDGGYQTNYIEVGGKDTGVLYATGQTVANIPGTLAPTLDTADHNAVSKHHAVRQACSLQSVEPPLYVRQARGYLSSLVSQDSRCFLLLSLARWR